MDNFKGSYRLERLPSGNELDFCWTIRRVKPKENLTMTLWSNDIFGIRTHYYQRRTTPCLVSGCEACEHQHLSRWHGYLLATVNSTKERVIFEFTPPAAVILDKAFQSYGTLRGLVITVSRVGDRPNGRVRVQVSGKHPNEAGIPKEPDIWSILSHLWGLSSQAKGRFQDDFADADTEHERVVNGVNRPVNGLDNSDILNSFGEEIGRM